MVLPGLMDPNKFLGDFGDIHHGNGLIMGTPLARRTGSLVINGHPITPIDYWIY